uniref:G-protein coupled receptors family 1 profile domain-containing protein n=1 Tax=Plectus sambesii TaxID=2011161 RepID=A0A914WUT6_9BILA
MQCNPASNASSNLTTPLVEQRVLYAELLEVYKYYIGFGIFAVITNIVCMLVVLSKRHMREKYGTFGVLSFGYLLNCLGILLAGLLRTHYISGNVYNSLNSFECFGRPWPYLFIVGGHLPAFALLCMGVERLIAVNKPLIYRTYITARARIIANIVCVLLSVISLLVGALAEDADEQPRRKKLRKTPTRHDPIRATLTNDD